MNHTWHRPSPLLTHNALAVDRDMPAQEAAERLADGQLLIVTDVYGTGADILEALKQLLSPPRNDAHYSVRNAFTRDLRAASKRLLLGIVNHQEALNHPTDIGFLKELYPEHSTFALPFVDVQELYGAWKLHQSGLHLAVLGHKLHPFYGTYAPTRTSHLELFATWLSQYKGARTRAVDVGTGCGILGLMLCKASFEQVLATDTNPNAVESVRRELARLTPARPMTVEHADLLGTDTQPVDLVVFNPPWILGTPDGLVDRALYYEEGLFERFFTQAAARLSPEGRVVMVFSNVLQLVQPKAPHPIEAELEQGRFTLVQKLARKVKPPVGKDGRRRRTKERVEVWELKRTES